ncbi:MAG TPA: prepilin-type N-terminal cleavage/methylation domain-containing protein, partial [Candidatus Deferrimicrobium sp.]
MPAPDARRGFTLLELVIALAILSMIVGSVAAAIRLAAGSIERGEAVTRDAARLRAVVGIFARSLMSADPLPIPVGDNTTVYFVGEEKSVRFLTVGAPSAVHGGGLRLISFFERTGGEGSGIAVATASPFRAEGAERWEGTEKARILVPGGGGARLLLLRGSDEGRGVGMAPGVGSEGDGPTSRRRAGGVQRAVPVRPPEDRVRGA